MMTAATEYFGDPGKIDLMRTSSNLWQLLRDDLRFAYYGRLIALSSPGPDTADILTALARIQGAAVAYFYPAGSVGELFAELQARGLTTDRHEHFLGGEPTIAASRALLERRSLPDDLTVTVVDAGTPTEIVADIARLCLSCEVMPIHGSAMRGQLTHGICLAARDRSGRTVATAASYMPHHPASAHARDVFWGMLATHPDRRGEGIALLLGARAIVHMSENHGALGFMTGVRSENAASRALCAKLNVGPTEWVYASCIDQVRLGSSSITK